MLDTRKSENVYFVIRLADFAILAQLIEHSIRNRKVVGLNPMDGSIIFNNLREFGKAKTLLHTRKHTKKCEKPKSRLLQAA